jgi:hypothetical protein
MFRLHINICALVDDNFQLIPSSSSDAISKSVILEIAHNVHANN